jgi:hypothetical protein
LGQRIDIYETSDSGYVEHTEEELPPSCEKDLKLRIGHFYAVDGETNTLQDPHPSEVDEVEPLDYKLSMKE